MAARGTIDLLINGRNDDPRIQRWKKSLLNWLRGTSDDMIDDFAKEIFRELVRTTPVKTGRARSLWNLSIGSPVYKEFFPTTKGMSIPPPEVPNIKIGYRNNFHITNSAPYIQRLNDGWSKQASSGFIEAAIDTASIRTRGKTYY